MRCPSTKASLLALGLVAVGTATIGAGEAEAKRIRLGGSAPVVVPRVTTSSSAAGAAAGTAAVAAPVDTKAQEAERAAAFERAKAKLDAERGPVTVKTVGGQVNTSTTVDVLTCIAGCYK